MKSGEEHRIFCETTCRGVPSLKQTRPEPKWKRSIFRCEMFISSHKSQVNPINHLGNSRNPINPSFQGEVFWGPKHVSLQGGSTPLIFTSWVPKRKKPRKNESRGSSFSWQPSHGKSGSGGNNFFSISPGKNGLCFLQAWWRNEFPPEKVSFHFLPGYSPCMEYLPTIAQIMVGKYSIHGAYGQGKFPLSHAEDWTPIFGLQNASSQNTLVNLPRHFSWICDCSILGTFKQSPNDPKLCFFHGDFTIQIESVKNHQLNLHPSLLKGY